MAMAAPAQWGEAPEQEGLEQEPGEDLGALGRPWGASRSNRQLLTHCLCAVTGSKQICVCVLFSRAESLSLPVILTGFPVKRLVLAVSVPKGWGT